MKNKKIILFKRSKEKKFSTGIEYILCTNQTPTIISPNLKTISSYVNILSKINGKKVDLEYSILRDWNSKYSYSNFNNYEKKAINNYIFKKKKV
jgi:hypothetical protein